jgi:hypothetical protein
MSRDYLAFAEIEGKLDMLRVTAGPCRLWRRTVPK